MATGAERRPHETPTRGDGRANGCNSTQSARVRGRFSTPPASAVAQAGVNHLAAPANSISGRSVNDSRDNCADHLAGDTRPRRRST